LSSVLSSLLSSPVVVEIGSAAALG